MNRVFVGIDIGTTAIKIAATDEHMTPLYENDYLYDCITLPNGWIEIEPTIWKDLVFHAIDEMIEHHPYQITAIGITGQMHTTVFLDKNGQSVRPAILWNDMRTKDLIPQLKQFLGSQMNLSSSQQKAISNGSPIANIFWLKTNEMELYRCVDKVVMPVNYVNFTLTGQLSLDYCDASTTGLFDLEKRTWCSDIFRILEFSPTIFPTLIPASNVVGYLLPDLCERWQQNNSVAIIAGTGDNVASALATGSFDTEQPVISLGTSGVLVFPNRKSKLNKVGKNVIAEIVANDLTMISQGTVQTGAKLNSWWLENIVGRKDYSSAQDEIISSKLGSNPVFFIPHLKGEKTLFANPNLRGAFFGLGLDTEQSDMYLAVLEGLAFGMKMLFDQMNNLQNIQYLSIVGGGAKSRLWVEVFANIFNYPIKRIISPCEAVHGAIRLAIMSQNIELKENLEEEVVYPTDELVKQYQKQYEIYHRWTKLLVHHSYE